MTRRQFIAAVVGLFASALIYDATVNEGHPALADEGDEEPP